MIGKEIKVCDCPLGDTQPLRPELSAWEYTDHLHSPEEGNAGGKCSENTLCFQFVVPWCLVIVNIFLHA